MVSSRSSATSVPWSELTRFAAHSVSQATLGVVSGRRRQGKTFLLDALTAASHTRLLLFTGGGFTEDLRDRARQDPTIDLIDLPRLYTGS